MTYNDFLRLTIGATEFDSLEDYIVEEGGSVPDSIAPDTLVSMFGDVYTYAQTRSVAAARTLTGMSRAAFCREYGLPVRSVQNWETNGGNKRNAPPYIADLLAFAVISNKYARPPQGG